MEVKRIKSHTWSSGLDKCGDHEADHWHGSTQGTVPRLSTGWIEGGALPLDCCHTPLSSPTLALSGTQTSNNSDHNSHTANGYGVPTMFQILPRQWKHSCEQTNKNLPLASLY